MQVGGQCGPGNVEPARLLSVFLGVHEGVSGKVAHVRTRACAGVLVAGATSLEHNDLDKTLRQRRGLTGLRRWGSVHRPLDGQGEARASCDFRTVLARQMVSAHSAKFRINNALLAP